jgi:hypothetical protein
MGRSKGSKNASGRAFRISDFNGGNQSCWVTWVKNCALVLDIDGEGGRVNTVSAGKSLKLHAVSLAFSKIITAADEFTVNVESVVVVSCDEDVGKNGSLSKRSDEVLTKIGSRPKRHIGVRGHPDPFGVGKIERGDMADV